MFLKLFLFAFLFNCAESNTFHLEDSFYENSKMDDIYTNHKNRQEVVNSYKEVYQRPYRSSRRIRPEKVSVASLEANSDLDRMDFHYPHVEFLTKNDNLESEYGDIDNTFTVVQNQQATDDNQNEEKRLTRFPRFRKSRQNITQHEYKPVRLSYIQKIPKPKNVDNENSKYAEISTELDDKSKTKDKINTLLKNYLAKLYSTKYNLTTVVPETATAFSDLQMFSGEPPETKFINNPFWLQKKKEKINKIKKLFSLFTVVQFNNTECNATSDLVSYLGLCYTDAECTDLGGTAVGNCASGYGVCCVFKGSCGDSAAQNCSYFESPNYPNYYPAGGGVIIPTTPAPPINPSPTPDPRLYWYFLNDDKARQNGDPSLSCIFSVYKMDDRITTMKITFVDLELAGPTTGTCTVERLVITGQNANSVIPSICGYNTGQSIYVDVSQSSGPLKLMILSTMAYKKRFKIMICQYADTCLQDNCLQRYEGITGTISSFNYDQSTTFNRSVPGYFNNLNYAICIRKEDGYCSITYTNVRNGVEYPFSMVNFVNGVTTVPLGMAGVDILDCPNDYIVIDGTRMCGYKFNDGSINVNASVNAPVTDTSSGPIVIPVRTNAAAVGYGFRLFYTQNRCIT